MKTRAQIYGQEAAGLLKIISMYPGLNENQLCRFYPEKADRIPAVLAILKKQGRIGMDTEECYFSGRETENKKEKDRGLLKAVWVLLDFLDKTEYHSVSEFPVKIIFFAGGELYEIICVEKGQEALVGQLLNQNREGMGKRIVIVEEPAQISQLEILGVSGFCTVTINGKINYYKKNN